MKKSKIILKVPVEKKKFVFGRCIYNDNCVLEEAQFKDAVDNINKLPPKERIPLLAATGMIPYLDEKYLIIMSNPMLGKIISFDYKESILTVETGSEYPAYKLLIDYKEAMENGDACADVGIFGKYIDIEGGFKKLDIAKINSFTFFVRKEELTKNNSRIMPNDFEDIRIPMFIQRDENDIYKTPNGYYYTKDTLLKAYNKPEFQELISGKKCPVIVGTPDMETGGIPQDQIAGFAYEYNIDNGYIKAMINTLSPHGKMILSNKDKIGNELFVGMLMLGEPKKSDIVIGVDARHYDTKELDIDKIFGFQIIRKNNKMEDKKDE